VVVECVLRPGAGLRCKKDLATAVRCVAAGGQLGTRWRARRAAREGNRAGRGRGRRVEVISAGGGAAAAAKRRPEVKYCRWQEAEQRNTCARKKKRGRGSGGPIWKSQKLQGPLGKLKFPTDVEV
jgi:hypothetical protein